MSDNKSYRIKANVGEDSVLNINLNQDFKTFEILSLKFDSDNLYKFHTSNYGCVAGRVLANGNFGIPNAKISIFIKATEEDLSDAILSYLYPYKNTRTKNDDGIRYNLLPDQQLSDCHRNVGTFPNKRLVLDDNNVFEVYDKYYKYTTRSNSAGDFMIFGVPVGEQTIHVDIDLSDIGILSQRPRDMFYKGYNATQFENANMFKKDVNLDSLTQIISQNSNVYVYPFWGERTEGDVAITRKDIEIQYKFEPTCVFMGSIITDEKSNAISKNCVPSERMGKMDRLTTGNGTIEMIRKKPDGSVEEVIIQGNQLIDGNGVWCYQIPMNLDYVCTDEYGNIVPTDDPKKGIPTRTRARFRMSIIDADNGAQFSHGAKTLVPNNPQTEEDVDYTFGTYTMDDEYGTKSFRDLFWNQVYSVKSYIPRFQQRNYNRNKRFTGFKVINDNGSNNPLPYNNMRIDISFIFGLQCAIFHILLWIIGIYNNFVYHAWNGARQIGFWGWYPIRSWCDKHFKYLYIGDSFCPDLEGWYFAPKAEHDTNPYENSWNEIKNSNNDFPTDKKSIENRNKESSQKVCFTNNVTYLTQCVEINLAMEYDVIQFDFYNDWMNGLIYSPRWNADIRKKRSYLFGLIKIRPRLNACSEENFNSTRRMVQQCAMTYKWDNDKKGFLKNATSRGCGNSDNYLRCHKAKGRIAVPIFGSHGGIVHKEQTLEGNNVYYYKPYEWHGEKRFPFFATDIILLGSLNENDSQGIPQTFKKLVSSTYQLPDPLAGTNIGLEGFLYGIDGVVCNGKQDVGNVGVTISSVQGSFDNVLQWTQGRDDDDTEPYDDTKPITETSGIDWGISGPDQGDVDKGKLYFPGGHFLGISCFNSEANIKSCVNLSRVCELGSTISHRQTFITKVNNKNNNYQFVYTIPTGIISGDEILDYGVKNEFATLNYNGLKTRRNIENNLLEYDFKTIFPINFDGNLNEKINNSKYQREYNSETNEFIRTIEESSVDYYKFRLGINFEETDNSILKNKIKQKYLDTIGSNVSMPVYENSFYFYFGINNGNTALDKFNKEFFAECPSMNIRDPKIIIKNKDGECCDVDENGKVRGKLYISTIGVTSPSYRINGFEYVAFNDASSIEIASFSDDAQNTQYFLSGEKYIVEINGENISTVSRNITFGVTIPEDIMNIGYNLTDFSEETFYTSEDFFEACDTGVTGSVELTDCETGTTEGKVIAVLIATNSFYHYLYKGNNSINLPDEISNRTEIPYGNVPGGIDKCYLWAGNINYALYIKKVCKNGILSAWMKHSTFSVFSPQSADVMFNGNENFTYRKVIDKWRRTNNKNGDINLSELLYDTGLTKNIRNEIRKLLFYKESKYDIDNFDTVLIEYINPDENMPVTLSGSPESILEDSNGSYLSFGSNSVLDFSALEATYYPTAFAFYSMPSVAQGTYMTKQHLYELYNFNCQESEYFGPFYYIVRGEGTAEVSYDNGRYFTVKTYRGGKGYYVPKPSYCLNFNGKLNYFDLYYLPFFLKGVIISTGANAATSYASIAIINAIKDGDSDDDKYSVKINGEEVGNKLSLEFLTLNEISQNLSDLSGDFTWGTVQPTGQFVYEDAYPVDVVGEDGAYGFLKPLTIDSSGSYTISVTDCAGRKIEKTVSPNFIGKKKEDGTYVKYDTSIYDKLGDGSDGIRYYVLSADDVRSYFTAFYKAYESGISPKKIKVADRIKFLVSPDEYQSGYEYYVDYFSPFFPEYNRLARYIRRRNPDWDIFNNDIRYDNDAMQYYQWQHDSKVYEQLFSFCPSSHWLDFCDWPLYHTQNKGIYMWSSWTKLAGKRALTKEELKGTIANVGEGEYIVGVYDANYHCKEQDYSVGNYIMGDPVSSSIVVVKIYTLSEFNNHRRNLGLIK